MERRRNDDIEQVTPDEARPTSLDSGGLGDLGTASGSGGTAGIEGVAPAPIESVKEEPED